MLKIAQIVSYFYPVVGGIEKTTLETSKRLANHGYDVTVYTSASNFDKFNSLSSNEHICGIKIKRFKERLNIVSTWIPKIDNDTDILHFENYNIWPHTYLLKKYYQKKPMVVTFHGGFSCQEEDFPFSLQPYRFVKYIWQYLYGKRYLKKIDRLIVLNVWEKQNLIKKGAPEDKIEIIPNGIEDEAFANHSPKILNKPYILSLCRLSWIKSLDHIIRILNAIPEVDYVAAGPDVGEGELDRLKILAKAYGVEGRVKFIGEITGIQKYQYLAGAELVIVPSKWEMQSHTILEAMAQGKIVIASDSFGNPYIIDDQKTGLIYPYGDLNKLQKLIRYVLGNKNDLQILGKNAKEKLRHDYRWDIVVDKIEKVYYSLINKY